MKYLQTLIIAALLSLGSVARANVAAPMCARIQDSGSFTFDGSNWYRFMGPICLMTDNSIQFLAYYASGPKAGTSEWLTAATNFPVYSELTCAWVTPTWTALGPYMDPGPAHLCGNNVCTNYDGTYRVIGDGDGTGTRAGVVLRATVSTVNHTFILAIKTASDRGGSGTACGFGGPGSINQFILLDQQPHCSN